MNRLHEQVTGYKLQVVVTPLHVVVTPLQVHLHYSCFSTVGYICEVWDVTSCYSLNPLSKRVALNEWGSQYGNHGAQWGSRVAQCGSHGSY